MLPRCLFTLLGFQKEKILISKLSLSKPISIVFKPDLGTGELILKAKLFFTNSGCTKNIKIWSPFWIINYTDLNLTYAYKEKKILAGQGLNSQPRITNKIGNLIYAHDSTIEIRSDNFEWCDAIDFKSTQMMSSTAIVRTPTWDFHLSISMVKAPLRVCVIALVFYLTNTYN
jgi:hypothetical protein